MKFPFVLAPFFLCGLCACNKDANTGDTSAAPSESGINISYIDSTVAPGDNFSNFANGRWYDTASVIPGYPYNGAMIKLTFDTKDTIGMILKEVAQEPEQPADTPKGQIQAFYASYMDTVTRNALGISPLKDELDRIFAAGSRAELAKLMGEPDYPGILGSSVFLDARNTQRYVYILEQGKLGSSVLEYYLADNPASEAIRKAYLAYMERLFSLAGISDPEARSRKVLSLETAMAKMHWTKTQSRDKLKMYHLMSVDELKSYAPGFEWDAYLLGQGVENVEEMVVHTDTAVKGLAEWFGQTPLEDLKTLTALYLLNYMAPNLSDGFTQAHDAFFITALTGGDPESLSLESKAQFDCDKLLKWQLGDLYSDRYLTPELKEQAQTLVGYMKRALLQRLETNAWMDEPTRKEAIKKFNNIHWKTGRPDRIIDQSSLAFLPDDLVGNIQQIDRFNWEDGIQRLSEPKREWEWLGEPQMVNAYYQAEMNDVVLPVGILQPPCFNTKADAAANFGGILAVIGHEVGHGFDDNGSKSDAEGLLRDWWTEASAKEFHKRTEMLVDQYDQFEPIPGVHLNGRLTLGENIGDVGGLAIAYTAYRTYVDEQQGGKAPVIDGLTGDQRFFLAFAQMWSWLVTDEFARFAALTDPHSPGEFRAMGPARNMDAWYAAFEVKPGDAMYLPPEDRVNIW